MYDSCSLSSCIFIYMRCCKSYMARVINKWIKTRSLTSSGYVLGDCENGPMILFLFLSVLKSKTRERTREIDEQLKIWCKLYPLSNNFFYKTFKKLPVLLFLGLACCSFFVVSLYQILYQLRWMLYFSSVS